VAELIGRLQRGEERFRRLRVEVESGQVFLSGAVPSWPDLHAFARAVAELPGVSNVTLRSIRVDPPRR
jgi:osmotically-inducible protein OsmY